MGLVEPNSDSDTGPLLSRPTGRVDVQEFHRVPERHPLDTGTQRHYLEHRLRRLYRVVPVVLQVWTSYPTVPDVSVGTWSLHREGEIPGYTRGWEIRPRLLFRRVGLTVPTLYPPSTPPTRVPDFEDVHPSLDPGMVYVITPTSRGSGR